MECVPLVRYVESFFLPFLTFPGDLVTVIKLMSFLKVCGGTILAVPFDWSEDFSARVAIPGPYCFDTPLCLHFL